MEEKKGKGITWIDLVIIGLALFTASVIENAICPDDKVIASVVFFVVCIALVVVGYLIKYLLFDRDK